MWVTSPLCPKLLGKCAVEFGASLDHVVATDWSEHWRDIVTETRRFSKIESLESLTAVDYLMILFSFIGLEGAAMAQQSAIEWTDLTWNPVVGCSIASSGCTNCYAMRMAARLESMGIEKYQGLTRKTKRGAVWTDKVNCDEASVDIPLRWKKPRRVFVNSMSDLFHRDVPAEFVTRIWAVMKETPQHHYQILTKRPARMAKLLADLCPDPLKNVWLGTSVEGPRVVDRIDELKRVPAAVRFISFEPLIASVGDLDLTDIDWAIVGGESGPRSRPMDENWVLEILDACKHSDTAFFFKQWGGVNKKKTGRLLNGITYDEMPEYISREHV